MSICGLDFGTSNTTLGTIEGHAPVLAALEAGQTTIPSAIFYEVDGAVLIGRKAIEAYVDGAPGRLMRSLKSVLGTSLIDETTRLGRERTGFRDVIAYYLGAVKRRAEQATGRELRDVVHGRPVHFVDNAPDADRKAEQTLRQIAREVGFDDVTFQFEPIAAALDYERQITAEEVALIADIGGGTSDFSIVRLGPERHSKADRSADILANDGVRIGGTDFDRQLSLGVVMPLFGFGSAMKRAGLDVPSSYFHDFATWSEHQSHVRAARARRYPPGPARGQRARTARSAGARGRGATRPYAGDGSRRSQNRAVRQTPRRDPAGMGRMPASTPPSAAPISSAIPSQLADRIAARIKNCLTQARLTADDIDAVFLTGGSVKLAHVRKAITKALPSARIVEGDIFGAVGKGLTLEALRRYGPRD